MFLSLYKEKIYRKRISKMEVPGVVTYRIWLDFGIMALVREYRHALLHTRGGYMLACLKRIINV